MQDYGSLGINSIQDRKKLFQVSQNKCMTLFYVTYLRLACSNASSTRSHHAYFTQPLP